MAAAKWSRRGLFTLVAAGSAAFLPGAAAAERVATVQVGGTASALAVSPVTGLVYVTDPQAGLVAVIDPDQARVVSTLPVNGEPGDVAVDRGRIYVANPPGGTVAVYDSQTHQLLSVVSAGDGASALALDEPANLVYAVSGKTGTFAILDSISLTLQRLLPAPKPGLAGIALDRGRRRAYCTSPGTNSVEICDLDAQKFSGSVDVGASPTGIGVHQRSGAVFVANSAIHHLSIVDGQSRTQTKTILLRSEASSLAVHQGTDTVYTNGGQNGLSRVDGRAELLTGELSLGVNPGQVAVDQRTRTVYVSDPLHGTVTVVRDF